MSRPAIDPKNVRTSGAQQARVDLTLVLDLDFVRLNPRVATRATQHGRNIPPPVAPEGVRRQGCLRVDGFVGLVPYLLDGCLIEEDQLQWYGPLDVAKAESRH